MTEYHKVARASDIPEGEGRAFQVGDLVIAVFRDQGRYFAITDRCPHAGASLSCGSLDNGTVTCSWHAWRFRLEDGAWADNPKLKIDTYPVRVQEDEIQVAVPGPHDSGDT